MSSRSVARCGVCAALLAVSAVVSIPIGPVPVTLQTLVLAMSMVALGWRDAAISVAVYLLAGLAGLPVFSGASGGFGVLLGPTGGFLWGFLAGAVAAGLIDGAAGAPRAVRDVAAPIVQLLVSYASGTAQLMLVMSLSLPAALLMAVVPFVAADAVKLAVGIRVGRSVRRALAAGRSAAGK